MADRVDLRKLLIVTQTLYCTLAALLWALAVAGAASVAALVATGVAGGVVQIADSPARQALVSRLVPPDDLASAVSLIGVVVNSARVVGPALAGVLIVTVGTTICFGLNSLSYLAVIAALLVIRPRKAGGPAPAGRRGVKEGLKYAASRQQLWLPLLMMSLVGLLAFNFSVVLPVFAKDTFHGSGGTYGLLTTTLSVGAVVGSLAVGLVHHPRRQYLLVAALGFGVTSAATAAAPNVAVACATLLVMGAAASALSHCARPPSSCIARVRSEAGSWHSGSSSTWGPHPLAASSPGGSSRPAARGLRCWLVRGLAWLRPRWRLSSIRRPIPTKHSLILISDNPVPAQVFVLKTPRIHQHPPSAFSQGSQLRQFLRQSPPSRRRSTPKLWVRRGS